MSETPDTLAALNWIHQCQTQNKGLGFDGVFATIEAALQAPALTAEEWLALDDAAVNYASHNWPVMNKHNAEFWQAIAATIRIAREGR